MTKLTSVRIVLALALAVFNAALFANATSGQVPRPCNRDCVEMPGGALGWSVHCLPGGSVAGCRARLTDCVGYGCLSPEASPEVVFEALPAELPEN